MREGHEVRRVNGSILLVDPLKYIMYLPLLHNWCNTGRGVHCPMGWCTQIIFCCLSYRVVHKVVTLLVSRGSLNIILPTTYSRK